MKESQENYGRLFGMVTVIVFIAWFAFAYFSNFFNDWSSLGVSDKFTALSTLFSGFAFAGLIITIYIQQKQIESQRKDFLESQKMKERTALAQERTADAQENVAKLQENISKIQEATAKTLNEQAIVSEVTARFTAVKILYDVLNIEYVELAKREAGALQRLEKEKDLREKIKKCLNEIENLKIKADTLFDKR